MTAKNFEDLIFMGIDYGERNIGIALGRNGLATPIKIIPGKNIPTALHEISRMAIENRISKFVVGLPLDHQGKETKQSLATRKFVKLLRIYTKKPVDLQNETGTSREALAVSIDSGIPMTRRALLDHVSAALILRHYFEDVSHP